MACYRARPNVILHAAIDAGVGTHTSAIAAASRLSERTVRRALNGEAIGAGSMGALCLALAMVPGDCFVPADAAQTAPAPSLRSVHRRARRASGE